MEQVSEKWCRKCGEVKPKSDFYRNSSKKDGLGGRCKSCAKVETAKWHSKNKDKGVAARKKYYESNRDKYRVNNARWRKENTTRSKEIIISWRKSHPEKLRGYSLGQAAKITDNYIAKLLDMPISSVPAELIELKRVQLQITRELRSKK